MKEVVIAGAARTPMGGFQGVFDGVPAADLGGSAMRATMDGAGLRTAGSVREHPVLTTNDKGLDRPFSTVVVDI